MANINISTVHLLSVPLDKSNKHTMWFNGKDKSLGLQYQYNWFIAKKKHTMNNCTYIREDSMFVIDISYDEAIKCNYVMYQNPAFSNKWFYAFITDYERKSDESTKITIKTDPMQTWRFDYKVLPSFIEREHTDIDTIGYNTIPEGLETGEYVCNAARHKNSLKFNGYVVASTIDLYDKPNPDALLDTGYSGISGAQYNGIYSGLAYFYFGSIEALNDKIAEIALAGKSDGIVAIFVVPSTFVKAIKWKDTDGFIVNPSTAPEEQDWAYYIDGKIDDTRLEAPDALNYYTPNNKKLFTYPYCYLLASNNSGGGNVYQWEHFDMNTDIMKPQADFKIWSSITPGMSIRMVPKNYKGLAINNEEGLNLGKFPICAWTTDVYTNWLTQNSLNIGINLIGGAMSVIGSAAMGIATGGIGAAISAGGVMSGIGQITNQLAQIHQQSFQSPTAQGNLNSGDVSYSAGYLTFSLYSMSIKSEYAFKIDQYFDRYGYKQNRFGVPLENHRFYWWYTKTVDVNIKGDIPQQDLDEIKQCYNDGITFWKDTPDSPIKEYKGINAILPKEVN